MSFCGVHYFLVVLVNNFQSCLDFLFIFFFWGGGGTLVNVYVDLVVFTRIAGTSYTGSGRY